MQVPERVGSIELRTCMRPPCSWTMDELSHSPTPEPFNSFVVKNASKMSRKVFGRNPDPSIRDGHANRMLSPVAPKPARGDSDQNLPAGKRSFDRIANEIGKDLPKLCGKTLNLK